MVPTSVRKNGDNCSTGSDDRGILFIAINGGHMEPLNLATKMNDQLDVSLA